MIKITPAAIKKLNHLYKNSKDTDFTLRLTIDRNSLCGNQIRLLCNASVTRFDKEFIVNGIKFVINRKYYSKTKAITIDYSDDLLKSGFKITYQNERDDCNCH